MMTCRTLEKRTSGMTWPLSHFLQLAQWQVDVALKEICLLIGKFSTGIADQRRRCTCPATQAYSGDGLPVSAVPGSAHNSTVSHVVPAKSLQSRDWEVQGRREGSPKTTKLPLSTPGERNVLPKTHGTRSLQLAFEFLIIMQNTVMEKSFLIPEESLAPGKKRLQELCRLPKRKRTSVRNCTCNARSLASDAAIEGLMMLVRKFKYNVIGLTETRRHHSLNAVYDSGEELFLETCDSRGVGGVDVLVNTNMAVNIDSFEQITTRIGRLRMRRCVPTPTLTILVGYAPTSSYGEEVEAFSGPGEVLQKRSYLLQSNDC
ncbi:hypothetical protein RB195_000741 [Necator americanus]|uniref:Uncharacterized protein n=1 Tax=Necator americanus TaxID=51031 RepID=A0ABR1DB51_NECAM